MNAVTTKDIFPLFKENKIWYGITVHSGDRAFNVPDDYPLEAMNCGIDKDGKRFIRVNGVRWFTNLSHNSKRTLELTQRYDPDKYPKYDNYDAIEVSRIKDIPYDYDGVMGVPITILDYDFDEIDTIACSAYSDAKYYGNPPLYVNGNKKYARILIRLK